MTGHLKPPEESTVLIVEDEARLRDVLVSSARECGFLATATRSAEDAITQMDKQPSDIIMLDLNLPCMDGLQCFEIIRERWPLTSVVILTGFGTLAAAQQAIRLGVAEFLTKPASLGDIEQALHRAWRMRFDGAENKPEEDTMSATDEARHTEPAHPKPRHATTPDTPRTMREIEYECIVAALERHKGNRKEAAAELGMSVRTLYYRLVEYRPEDSHTAEGTD